MKLWKSKKAISCVPGKSSNSSNSGSSSTKSEEKYDSNGIPLLPIVGVERAMSPAQSEDSGLAPERGSTYATISLPRENAAQNMGITFAERNDLSYPPVIGTLSPLGHAADFLAPGDRIHQVDGISTIGLSNQHIMSMLCHGDGPAVVEIEYSLPEYLSQNSLCVTSKLAQITVERESGCLGLTLRGGSDYPLIVTHVRPHGPVFKTGRIKPGDRLLRVDNISLIGKTLVEAQSIIKCGGHVSGYTNLTIEYDVSVMQSVEFSMGPLLIEIERPMNDKLGVVLCNYSSTMLSDRSKIDEVSQAAVYIASILPASIADRCGALSVGDQILSIDDTIIENTAYSPDEVMTLLDSTTGRGFTQMQILPAHAVARRGHNLGSPKYGFNTLESRKSRQRQRFARKSSLPLESSNAGTMHSSIGICRAETFQVVLDCTHGSGIILGATTSCGKAVTIAQIVSDSVADRSGCIQKGDRIIAVNKMSSLEVNTIRQLLGDVGPRPPGYQGANWIELEIEFDMSDAVVPSSGVFNVKLPKTGKGGMGISVNGSSHNGFVISEVKPGSLAHRTGSVRAGDVLLAVDNHPLQHFNVDAMLKEGGKNEYTTLTIKRNLLPDFLFDAQQKINPIYSNCGTTSDHEIYGSYASKYGEAVKYNDCISIKSTTPQPEYFRAEDSYNSSSVQIRQHPSWALKSPSTPPSIGRTFGAENTVSLTTEMPDDTYNDLSPYDLDYPNERFASPDCMAIPPPMESKIYGTSHHQTIFTVRLEPKGGLLGITLAGSEETSSPISISGMVEGGIAYKTGQLQVGDQLLAINDESVQGMPLSYATKMLQKLSEIVDLKILRQQESSNAYSLDTASSSNPQPQVIYAKVQRRPRSPSSGEDVSNTNNKDSKHRTFHVTLYKDKVYDDYGFSISDGLYERGVFINRIRSGGPADMCSMLKPFDRIMQVNEMKTQDFDCCLTVPLIAAAGDKIDLIIQRSE
ncbi:glutamate receptor-interacting protein 2 isoform X2 [Eupeodes corollae]|uniref:glutamate receptor-interacting protein 2 isoform X2 n=1 Tax=Eupeodes corollae TaxID=290404 RepID=UPI002491D094|nr:glutamate receptor-interacting protein 2 isoform X2 [Eupeodes corollae]